MQVKNLLTTLFIFMTIWVNAQSYELTISNEPYTDLLGSTSLNGEMTWDDPEFTIPIGFDFTYFTETFSTLTISEWGLGGYLTPPLGFSDISPMLAPYGADIIDRGYDFTFDEPTTGSQSNISYLLEGSEGSRILKIEWNNVGFYTEVEDDNVSSDFTNFQMWLYEGSNDIEIRFGDNSINDPEASFDEQSGSWIGLFEEVDLDEETLTAEAYTLSGTPESAVLTSVTGSEFGITFLDGIIPPGTVYKFTEALGSSTSNELAKSLSLDIFPNPVTDILEIKMEQTEHQINGLAIRNLTGQVLKEIEYQGQESIDFSEWSAGVYLLEINTSAGMVHQKIIKD